MKLKITYSILFSSLVLLTLMFFNTKTDEGSSKIAVGKNSLDKTVSVNDAMATDNKLEKIISSIRQLQQNIENQDKKFQVEIALLKNSNLGLDKIEDNMPIEEVEDNISSVEKEQQAQEWYENQTTAIETAMADEKIDEKWTEDTLQRIEVALDASNNNIGIKNITCGGTICKLNAEMKGENMSYGPNIDHLVYGDMEWDGPILSEYNADTGEITIFLMRPGVDMADFEPQS